VPPISGPRHDCQPAREPLSSKVVFGLLDFFGRGVSCPSNRGIPTILSDDDPSTVTGTVCPPAGWCPSRSIHGVTMEDDGIPFQRGSDSDQEIEAVHWLRSVVSSFSPPPLHRLGWDGSIRKASR
jgi:hypothetical protein